MKKIYFLSVLFFACISSMSQTSIHYWNFNSGASANANAAWSSPIAPTTTISTASLEFDFTQTEDFNGSTLDASGFTSTAGVSFCPVNSSNNDKSLVLSIPTTGYSSIKLTYAAQRTSTGFTTQTIEYSTDGTTFILLTTLSAIPTSFGLQTLDFSSLSAVNNNPNFKVRIKLSGATSTSGNNRIDNIRLTGTEIVADNISISAGTDASETSVAGSFTINFSTPTTALTSFDYSFNGTASFSTDYSASYSNGGTTTLSTANGTITVAPGTSSVTITITPTDDAVFEGTEIISLTISNPSGGYVLGTATRSINLSDNDAPPSASVAAGNNAAEPLTNGSFNINLSNPAPAGGVTVTYTLNGTATNTDYSDPQSGSVTISEGNASATLNLTVIDDALLEGTETIGITLTSASNGFVLGTTTASINILDNEIPKIVINQVYGGGGNSGATYKNDFIELYNNEDIAVNLSGWSVQYLSATGTGTWNTTPLTGTIPAHSFFLIQEAAGSGGTANLPTPDVTGTIAMGAGSGKVILSNSTTALTGANPSGTSVIDKVGYGSTATGYETAPAPGLDNTTALHRSTTGVDNNNNSTDFIVASPEPRNKSYITTAPKIVSLTPPDNSVDVPYNITPSIVFDKPVQKGSGTVSIFENGIQVATIDISSSAIVITNKNTVTINTQLASGKTYYIQISAGAFKDVYENSFTGITDNTSWNFTTYNTSVPVAIPVTFDFQNCTGSGLLPNGFTQYNATGTAVWDCTPFGRDPAAPAGTAAFPNGIQMNGYDNALESNVPNEDWLISPSINLTGSAFPLLSFWSRTRFNGPPLQLKISSDYSGIGDPRNATWTNLNGKFAGQTTDVWTLSSNINLSAFKATGVHIAFVYLSSNDEGARWTLDDISIINSATPPPPTLTNNVTDIQYTFVANGSFADKTFTFIGNDLVDSVIINATGNFTLSKDGVSFASLLGYSALEANNISKTVYVRFAPTETNQNYTGTVTLNTSNISNIISVKGTSIDPATTLEVVNWNIEWFGSIANGPTDNDKQEQNVKTILQNIGADIYGLVEVVDTARLGSVVRQLDGYSYVVGNYGSHVNPPEPNGGALGEAQKLGFVYKTSVFSNVTARPLIANLDTLSASYNNWASGRYPFLMTADVTLNCVTKKIHFIVLHAKANTAPTLTSYNRRKAAAIELHDTLETYFSTDNVIVLGDFNDDLDQTITDGINPPVSSYKVFTDDNADFFSPTLALSLAGKKSTVSYNDVIDHVMLTNELQPYYMSNTANILTDVTSLVNNYASSTSDHYPVFTRYQFEMPAPPVINTCPTVPAFCQNKNGSYTVPVFEATSNCGQITYSYSITGATVRAGTTNNATGNFTIGTSIITWTATDGLGQSSTCQTTVVINDTPHVNLPVDVFAMNKGVLPNTVYLGYAPASSVTINASVTEGLLPYSYTWSPNGGTNSSTTITPTTTTTFTLTVTDANGCIGAGSKEITAIDVRAGKNLDKVIICHKGASTQIVSQAEVATHLGHGDMLSSCTNNSIVQNSNRMSEEEEKIPGRKLSLVALPNPSANQFTLVLNGIRYSQNINLRLTDIFGRLVEQRNNLAPNQTINIGSNLRAGMYFVEVSQGNEKALIKLIKQ